MTEAQLVALLTSLQIREEVLDKEDLEIMLEAIENPPEPSERLKKAAEEYKKIVTDKKNP